MSRGPRLCEIVSRLSSLQDLAGKAVDSLLDNLHADISPILNEIKTEAALLAREYAAVRSGRDLVRGPLEQEVCPHA